MNIFTTLSKRKRIEALVKKSVSNVDLRGNYLSNSGLQIDELLKSFIEVWPTKYFDLADDRKIAGLVLAYMMEISEISVDEMNQHGYRLLKFTAEVDLSEFRENAPRTYEQLRRLELLETRVNELKTV